jgi:hypothetical protein
MFNRKKRGNVGRGSKGRKFEVRRIYVEECSK